MYPLKKVDTTTTATANWFTLPGSNMLDGFHADLSKIVSDYYTMQWCIFSLALYMAYILREMYYAQISALFQVYEEIGRSNDILRDMYSSQLQSQRVLREGLQNFEGLLQNVIRIVQYPSDIVDKVDGLHDTLEDLLSKIKREIRALRFEYNASKPYKKEETVELSASSAEDTTTEEVSNEVPSISPQPKVRGRRKKSSTPSSSSSSSYSPTPLLSSTRLGSRRANEMIQQATQ